MDDDKGNRESGKVRYRTRTSRVNGRLLVVVHFVEEGLVGEARLAVWVMYWHMYVIVAICRESERPKGIQMAGGEREIVIRVRTRYKSESEGERERERISSCGEDVSPRSRG